MRRLFVIPVLVAVMAGCAHAPPPNYVRDAMDEASREAVLNSFRTVVPERFNLLYVINIKYNVSNEIAALGVISVDRGTTEFTFACINSLGFKLFEAVGRDGEVTKVQAPSALMKKRRFLKTLADGLMHMYVDPIPSGDAVAVRDVDGVDFTETLGGKRLIYRFSGPGNYLAAKSFYRNRNLLWKIEYHDYELEKGLAYPGSILLDNYRKGYSIVARLKQVY
jgi:hypothetical protein